MPAAAEGRQTRSRREATRIPLTSAAMLSPVPYKWVLLVGSFAAGVLPMLVVVVVDSAWGSTDDRLAEWLLLVFGPPFGPVLVSLAFVARLRWRALWIAVGGYLVELVIVIAFLGLLSEANWS